MWRSGSPTPGRVITAAALIMSISFAAMIAAQVSFMRMFGLGLTLAILGDATLVRMLLVPAFMRVMGRVQLVGTQTACAAARAVSDQRNHASINAPAEGLSRSG